MNKKPLRFWSIVNTVAYLAMLTVNVLANALPINGMTPAAVSALFPNSFVPAGFTFSIWSVIYLLLLCFCVYSLGAAFGKYSKRIPYSLLLQMMPAFFLTCLLNVTWLLAWHHLHITLSVIIMLLLLGTLIYLFITAAPYRLHFGPKKQVCIRLPFTIYLGWISVATIANITAKLVQVNWDRWGLAEATWSVIMILFATTAGLVLLWRKKEAGYSLVIAWALFGIYKNQVSREPDAARAAITCFIALTAGSAVLLYLSYREKKGKGRYRANRAQGMEKRSGTPL